MPTSLLAGGNLLKASEEEEATLDLDILRNTYCCDPNPSFLVFPAGEMSSSETSLRLAPLNQCEAKSTVNSGGYCS